MSAAVQTRLDLAALEGGVACFGTRSPTHAVAVLDVVGAEVGLASADDATQEELLAGRAQLLNAQTSPFQVLVSAEPIDLEDHLRRVQARAALLPERLRAIALDYLGFVPSLAHQRTLLEQRLALLQRQLLTQEAQLRRKLAPFLDAGFCDGAMPEELADTAQQRLFIGVRTMAGPRTATVGPAHARMVAEADEPPCGTTPGC